MRRRRFVRARHQQIFSQSDDDEVVPHELAIRAPGCCVSQTRAQPQDLGDGCIGFPLLGEPERLSELRPRADGCRCRCRIRTRPGASAIRRTLDGRRHRQDEQQGRLFAEQTVVGQGRAGDGTTRDFFTAALAPAWNSASLSCRSSPGRVPSPITRRSDIARGFARQVRVNDAVDDHVRSVIAEVGSETVQARTRASMFLLQLIRIAH